MNRLLSPLLQQAALPRQGDRRIGGVRKPIVPQSVDDYMASAAFARQLRRMKVHSIVRFPFVLENRLANAVRCRILRLFKHTPREYRTLITKRTRALLIIRVA